MSTLNKIGRITALVSFLIGTIIFITYFLDKKTDIVGYDIVEIGMSYLLLALTINLVMALIFLSMAIFVKENRKKNLITFGLMCINIPIATVYFFIVISSYAFFKC